MWTLQHATKMTQLSYNFLSTYLHFRGTLLLYFGKKYIKGFLWSMRPQKCNPRARLNWQLGSTLEKPMENLQRLMPNEH